MTEIGEVLVQSLHGLGGGRVWIVRADPRIRIDVDLVARDRKPDWAVCTDDGVLTLSDDFGQRFIYKVDFDSYDPSTQSFAAEWPD